MWKTTLVKVLLQCKQNSIGSICLPYLLKYTLINYVFGFFCFLAKHHQISGVIASLSHASLSWKKGKSGIFYYCDISIIPAIQQILINRHFGGYPISMFPFEHLLDFLKISNL